MKHYKYVILLVPFLLGLTPIRTGDQKSQIRSINKNFTEIDAFIKKYNSQPYIQLRSFTTAQLHATIPGDIGQMYWNRSTNEIWISTGTAVDQFIHK